MDDGADAEYARSSSGSSSNTRSKKVLPTSNEVPTIFWCTNEIPSLEISPFRSSSVNSTSSLGLGAENGVSQMKGAAIG